MKSIFQTILFLVVTTTCHAQMDFVSNKTILPTKLTNNTVEIKVEQYNNDSLTAEFNFLTAHFNKNNQLKKVTCHKRITQEYYYLILPSEKKYTYRNHKRIIKMNSEFNGRSKSIDYFNDSSMIQQTYIKRGGFKWIRSAHRKKHFEWTRKKFITSYSYDTLTNTLNKSDELGNNVYSSVFDQHNHCIKKSYFYQGKVSWVQYYTYDSLSNMIEMVEIHENDQVLWRITNEYDAENLLISNKHFAYGDTLFSQINFTYKNKVLQIREDLDFKGNTKTLYYYSYR